MKKLTLASLFIFLASCASTKLAPGAEQVHITKTMPDLDKYEIVGYVSCSYPGSFSSVVKIIESCRNDLRNQAAEKSGTIVVIENEQMGAAQCLKCITMVGSAYKKK